MNVTIGNFQIRPYRNGLCWEVWELREKKPKKGSSVPVEGKSWQFTGKYPTTFEHALQTVYEMTLRKYGEDGDLKTAMRQARQLSADIGRAANKGAVAMAGEPACCSRKEGI